MKIVIPDRIDLTREHLLTLSSLGGKLKVYDDVPKSEEEIIDNIKSCLVNKPINIVS